MTLKELPIGSMATVVTVGGEGALRQHFLDMGLIPGVDVTMVKYAPMGDPVELQIHGYELTLRLADAEKIEIENTRQPDNIDAANHKKDMKKDVQHPGLGEGGKYHVKADEHPLPEGEVLTFALAGNQNCGKTTLFNQLTGSNQHVGNFPGVTVDRKDGAIKGHSDTLVTDLPGIYSMSPYSSEEIVTRQFVLEEHPKGIINIVDATNIERNLYLTMQLLELDVPMVLALNMMDEVRQNGGSIRVNELEELLGIPVVPISAAKNEGISELVDHALHVAKYQERPGRQDFCEADDHGGAVHRCLHGIMHLIEDHAKENDIPVRFAAAKLAEGDMLILDRLHLDQNEKETLEHIIQQMEKERGLDRAAAIADMRFAFISKVCRQTVIKPHESREHARSARIDKVLTGKYTAIPVFIAIMAAVFWLTFNVIGAALSNLLDMGIGWLTNLVQQGMMAAGVNEVLQSLIIDGIFNGVGSVLSFLPIIVTLFFFLSMLEDSGYMARVAYVMEGIMSKLGLSGRAFIPMILGFGCTVPAIMASRSLENRRDRFKVMLITPFMSCSARLPIYILFAEMFFQERAMLVAYSMYLIGLVVAILVAAIIHLIDRRKSENYLLIELPEYKAPSARTVAIYVWEKVKDYLTKAGTTIFVASILMWVILNFGPHGYTTEMADSFGSILGHWLVPIFAPIGLGFWQIAVALIAGISAKEVVVSSCAVLFGIPNINSGAGMDTLVGILGAAGFGQLNAFCLMIFCLLYVPCAAALATIRKESGSTRWMLFSALFQLVVAWAVTFVVYRVGLLL